MRPRLLGLIGTRILVKARHNNLTKPNQDARNQKAAGVSSFTKMKHDLHAFTFQFLTRQLARPTDRFSLLSRFFLRRLLEMLLQLHFTEHAFALKLFLQDPKGLINIIVANTNLHVAPTIIH
ncbi:hypothetical protein DSM107133_04041 (plasmid) [Pseudosulfitobacter sp. DSM 107133]|nr:hypothetical protein DSM107133_04041 [Pseudosulfitobacter sp. DSM 107133]